MPFKPANPDFAAIVRGSFATQGLMQLIGATLERVEPGEVDIALPFRGDLTQQHAFLHGAVTTAIADSAAGYAALSLMPAGSEVLSIEFKINLLRPATGPRFLAEGRVVKAGKTITVSRSDVFGYADNKPIHIATLLATMIMQTG